MANDFRTSEPELVQRRHPDPLARVVLVEPLIPENTGNISRTCVATHSELHLVEPMGFELTQSRVKRAGLDYWPDLAWSKYPSFAAWRQEARAPQNSPQSRPQQIFYVETFGEKSLYEVEFQRGDWLVFGKETTGLDRELITSHDATQNPVQNRQIISIPMPGSTRSLNLSNSVAIVVFELLRQVGGRPAVRT
jgi:tRNA (cytidine/uridine-2'-O-)-methyltransferase